MRLEKDTWSEGHFRCPCCNNAICIETTHESSLEDCSGSKSCPVCDELLYISNIVVFTAVKRGGT